jgi:hypothetical protein
MIPLARWTIGDVSDTGKKILRESVKRFRKAYPEFDYVVCHNSIDASEFENLGTDLFEQQEWMSVWPLRENDKMIDYEATGCGWKLCPPRLRPDSCELWIDNDLVICDRIKEIDDWIDQADHSIITEGLHRARMFGEFDSCIHPDIRACAGLFGLPPDFNFASAIESYSPILQGKKLGGFDEQGLTVAVVTNMPKHRIIPLQSVWISEDHVPFPATTHSAYHFVAANRKPWHRGWKRYRSLQASHLMI